MVSAPKSLAGPLQCREYRFAHELGVCTDARVAVWRVDLEANAGAVAHFRSLLTADELSRADKFRFEKGRNEFTITRGALRELLSHYLEVSPRELRFRYAEQGKPELEGSPERLQFNVSHTEGMAVIGIAKEHRLGVDVEKIRFDIEHQDIAERFFSEDECRQLRSVPRQEVAPAFFRCWTRKEAFIKALGEGLSHPLSHFDVELRPGQPGRLLSTRPDAAEAPCWSLFDIPVPSGYVAALAMEDRPRLR